MPSLQAVLSLSFTTPASVNSSRLLEKGPVEIYSTGFRH